MKLKIGNTILNQQALKNLFWIFFFTGIYIGFGMALREDGKSWFSIPLFIILILILPKLIRGIKDEIQHERDVADKL